LLFPRIPAAGPRRRAAPPQAHRGTGIATDRGRVREREIERERERGSTVGPPHVVFILHLVFLLLRSCGCGSYGSPTIFITLLVSLCAWCDA